MFKDPTALARVASDMWVQSPAQLWGDGSGVAAAVVQIGAVAPIQYLAWELAHATGTAIKLIKNGFASFCHGAVG